MAGYFSACTFRTVGNAATTHTILTIENISGTDLVYVRKIIFQMDATAVLTTFMPLVKVSRSTAVPTGGTALAKGLWDTANASDANTIVRGATASDGGGATAITATAGDIIWQQFGMRLHTAVGQVLAQDYSLLPITIVELNDVVLRQNQALMVQVVAAAGTSNPATNMYFAGVVWEEN
jgi:hypothetical protein